MFFLSQPSSSSSSTSSSCTSLPYSSSCVRPSPSHELTLPVDILLLIRQILITNSSKATGASLAQCSKSFYEIFLPVLQYENIELRAGGRSWAVFNGLQSVNLSDEEEDDSYAHPSTTPLEITRYPFPTPWTHQRKLSLLHQCTNLKIQDLPSALTLIHAQDSIGSTTLLFPKLRQLILGSDLILSLAMELDTEGIRKIHMLSNYLKPKDMCLWFPSQTMTINDTISPPPLGYTSDLKLKYPYNHVESLHEHSADEVFCEPSQYSIRNTLDALQRCSALYAKSKSLKNFLGSFQPTTLTIHNVLSQQFVFISSVKHLRVFFACLPISQDEFGTNTLLMKTMRNGLELKRVNNIVYSLVEHKSRDRETRYTLIDAELPKFGGENGIKHGDVRGKREGEDSNFVPAGQSFMVDFIRRLTSGQYWLEEGKQSVEFATRKDVEVCDCCGLK